MEVRNNRIFAFFLFKFCLEFCLWMGGDGNPAIQAVINEPEERGIWLNCASIVPNGRHFSGHRTCNGN